MSLLKILSSETLNTHFIVVLDQVDNVGRIFGQSPRYGSLQILRQSFVDLERTVRYRKDDVDLVAYNRSIDLGQARVVLSQSLRVVALSIQMALSCLWMKMSKML